MSSWPFLRQCQEGWHSRFSQTVSQPILFSTDQIPEGGDRRIGKVGMAMALSRQSFGTNEQSAANEQGRLSVVSVLLGEIRRAVGTCGSHTQAGPKGHVVPKNTWLKLQIK